jgi:hypothetical protein
MSTWSPVTELWVRRVKDHLNITNMFIWTRNYMLHMILHALVVINVQRGSSSASSHWWGDSVFALLSWTRTSCNPTHVSQGYWDPRIVVAISANSAGKVLIHVLRRVSNDMWGALHHFGSAFIPLLEAYLAGPAAHVPKCQRTLNLYAVHPKWMIQWADRPRRTLQEDSSTRFSRPTVFSYS